MKTECRCHALKIRVADRQIGRKRSKGEHVHSATILEIFRARDENDVSDGSCDEGHGIPLGEQIERKNFSDATAEFILLWITAVRTSNNVGPEVEED